MATGLQLLRLIEDPSKHCVAIKLDAVASLTRLILTELPCDEEEREGGHRKTVDYGRKHAVSQSYRSEEGNAGKDQSKVGLQNV